MGIIIFHLATIGRQYFFLFSTSARSCLFEIFIYNIGSILSCPDHIIIKSKEKKIRSTKMSQKKPDTSNMIPLQIPTSSTHIAESDQNINLKPNLYGYLKYKTKPWMFAVIFVLIVVLWAQRNYSYFQHQLSIQDRSLKWFLVNAIDNLDKNLPEKYIGIEDIQSHAELPICIIVDEFKWSTQPSYQKSVQNQQYTNYKFSLFKFNQPTENSFKQLKRTVDADCQKNSILVFMDNPFAQSALRVLNDVHQVYNTWMTYDTSRTYHQSEKQLKTRQVQKSSNVQIISVYKRVFDLIENNDFWQMNHRLINGPWRNQFLMTSLFQLCRFYAMPIPAEQLFKEQNSGKTVLFQASTDKNEVSQQTFRRIPYQNMHSMAQDYQILNLKALDATRKQFKQSNSTITEKIWIFKVRSSKISHEDMERALQYEQLIYLPESHSFNLVQIKRSESKFNTGKYSEKELSLCININSRNNIKNGRYMKVMDSITAQNYTNYQIVFIDDKSSDETLVQTKDYLISALKFPTGRVNFVRNKQHTFATYNIINAAFNFCNNDSIIVLVDGDDQLIGKQAFKMINAEYQENDLWVMYTFYKSDKYEEGVSIPFVSQYLNGIMGGRKLVHFFGPIRTFKTSLTRAIPLSQHLNQKGNFFDTMYDTALQYPFFQMAGANHSKYVHQIAYLYYSGYGANDDSNIFKMIRRTLLHVLISFRSKIQPVSSLEGLAEDPEVRAILQKDKGVKYVQIK